MPVVDETNPFLTEQEKDLFLSAFNGDLGLVEKAVAKGAPVNAVDQKKRTPLLLAAHNGHTAVVEYLLENGAEVNARDSSGQTALHYVAKRSFTETANVLIENGIDVNAQSKKRGVTALMIAAVADDEKMVSIFLDNGADPHVTDFFGRSARFLAEQKGNSDVIGLLPESPEQVSDK